MSRPVIPLLVKALLLASIALPVVASAQGLQRPGSLLLFPEYDNAIGEVTLLTVTNTNGDTTVPPGGTTMAGTIEVGFVYVSGTDCLPWDRFDRLLPNDTRTVVTRAHNPLSSSGYVYAYARSVTTGAAVAFDHLTGMATRLVGATGASYSVAPFVFRAAVPPGSDTDVDGAGDWDFDGVEYEAAPDRVLFPRFLGQTSALASTLVLVDLSGGRNWTTSVDITAFNDAGVPMTLTTSFSCWMRRRLADLSPLFSNAYLLTTPNDPLEPVGFPARETGWFQVDGDYSALPGSPHGIGDPAILGCLIEEDGGDACSALPFASAATQTNGRLRLP